MSRGIQSARGVVELEPTIEGWRGFGRVGVAGWKEEGRNSMSESKVSAQHFLSSSGPEVMKRHELKPGNARLT